MSGAVTLSAVFALAVGSALGWALGSGGGPNPSLRLRPPPPSHSQRRAAAQTTPAPQLADVQLLAAKSDAQSLVVAGRLAEAHAAYRDLAAKTVGREFRGPLAWDLAEQAKAEQDRLFWVILTRSRGADLAFFRGRTSPAAGPGVHTSGRRLGPSARPAAIGPADLAVGTDVATPTPTASERLP